MEIFAGHGWIMTIIIGGLAGAVGKWIMPGKDPRRADCDHPSGDCGRSARDRPRHADGLV